jgi:hypothetical protein
VDDQKILEHFPELVHYSPHIVGKQIRAYATKSQFIKDFSHEKLCSLNRRAWELKLDGIAILHRPKEV